MPIHILQFFSVLGNGGAENRMMDVYRHLDKSQVQFDFAVLHDGMHFFDEEVYANGSKKYVLPDPRKSLFKSYVSMVRFFKEHKEIVAVHAHVAWFSGLVLLAAKHAGVKIRIAHAREARKKDNSYLTAFFRNVGKTLIRVAATQRIAVSEDAAAYVFGRRTARKGNYLYVPNSIDIGKYRIVSDEEKKELRASLGIPEGAVAYVTVASFREPKNHIFLLDIARKLKDLEENAVFYFIGDGTLRTEIESRISELHLENTVVLLGSRDDVPSILCAFDAMIFPSKAEGLGGVVLEAQLVGVPAIVSEAIPDEADVGVGMVLKLPLDLPAEEWAKEIVRFRNSYKWDYDETKRKFDEIGYSIENTAKMYLKEYGLSQEKIDKAVLT